MEKGRSLIRLICEKNKLPEMIVFEELYKLSLKFDIDIDKLEIEDIRVMLMDYLKDSFQIEEDSLDSPSSVFQ